MKIIKKPQELQNITLKHLKLRDEIGLVPTMGALHEGHISLIEKSYENDDITIVSIFVNPTQFGPNEDYLKYPRPIEKDIAICKKNHVDYVFIPSVEDMFNQNYKTFIEVLQMQDVFCGATRKGHFRGVVTVVAKLFNLSRANRAYFGMKDFQQLRIIEKMVKDLNFTVKIVPCKIVREKNGLALSSRNLYLSQTQKENAALINKALKEACEDFKTNPVDFVLNKTIESLRKIPESKIDYAQIADYYDLSPADKNTKKAVFLAAVWIGQTRLIDNIAMTK
jgi:pantoate--beta-alanine ligase